jgi:hypothetical protein
MGSIARRVATTAALVVALAAVPAAHVSLSATTGCPSFREPRTSGRIERSSIDEVSGIAASRRRPLLWIIEDSGNGPWIHAVRRDGSVVTTVGVTGATNRDWEDLALAGGWLWIGDIGDNERVRDEIQVYRIREPGPHRTVVRATTVRFRYPDGAHDAESLIVDARRDALFIVTKEPPGRTAGIYRGTIEDPADGRLRTLERVGGVAIAQLTGADRSKRGVVLRSYSEAKLFRWKRDRRVATALDGSACPLPVGGGETIAYRPADGRYYAIPEGGSPPIRFTSEG